MPVDPACSFWFLSRFQINKFQVQSLPARHILFSFDSPIVPVLVLLQRDRCAAFQADDFINRFRVIRTVNPCISARAATCDNLIQIYKRCVFSVRAPAASDPLPGVESSDFSAHIAPDAKKSFVPLLLVPIILCTFRLRAGLLDIDHRFRGGLFPARPRFLLVPPMQPSRSDHPTSYIHTRLRWPRLAPVRVPAGCSATHPPAL